MLHKFLGLRHDLSEGANVNAGIHLPEEFEGNIEACHGSVSPHCCLPSDYC